MKSKVILFCVLLFCSKIVDSTPHSKDLVRHRVNPLSNRQGYQNAPSPEYLETDRTPTRNVNKLTNSAIEHKNTQDYYSNQERYNYDRYGYNKSPVSSPLEKEILVSYDSPADRRRLDSHPPRVESYPSRTSQLGSNNQQYRNQNWRTQNQYTNSAPSAVPISDDEKPLVTSVLEPYRVPVQYRQPKYVSSLNRRYYQPDRSYLTREQFQYPLANNSDDTKYAANSALRYGSSGPVPYKSYSEGQDAAPEIKARPTWGQRHVKNFAPQPGIIYNDALAVVVPDTLPDQSENVKYVENYRTGSELSNTAQNRKYDNGSPVISLADTYSLDSKPSNGPYESYSEGQASATEKKAGPTGRRRYVQNFAPQPGITYDEAPAVDVMDSLTDQSEKVKYVKNYRLGSDLSSTVPITIYDDDSSVISLADNYSLDSRPSNGPVLYESYSESQAAGSELKGRPTEGRRRVLNFGPQPEITYNEAPAVVVTDAQADQSENIKYVDNYRLHSGLSNTARTNHDDVSRVISAADNYNSDSRPNNIAPVNTKEESPIDNNKMLSNKPLARTYANDYRSDPGWSNIARDDSYNGEPTVINETAQEKSRRYHEANYKSEYGSKEPVSPVPTDTVSINSGTNEFEESNVPPYGSSSPTPLSTNPKQNIYHGLPSGIREISLKDLVSYPEMQNILASTDKRYVVIHSNKTVQYLDTIDLKNHQNSKVHVLHTKPKNINDSGDDEVLATQPPDNVPNNIVKTLIPVDDEYPLPSDNQPADKESNPFRSFKDISVDHSNLKPLLQHAIKSADSDDTKLFPLPVNQPAYDGNSEPLPQAVNQLADNLKTLSAIQDQPADKDDSTPLSPLVNRLPGDHKSKPLPQDVNELKDEINLTPLSSYAKPPAHDKKSTHSYVNQPGEDNNSKPLPSVEDQSGSSNDSKYNKSETSYLIQPVDKNTSRPSPPDAIQPGNDTNSKLSPLDENKPGDGNGFNPLHRYERKPTRHYKSTSHVNQQVDSNDSNSSSPHENQPEKDKKLIPWHPKESQSINGSNSERTPVASKDDDQSTPTPLSPIVPDNATPPKPHVIKAHKRKHSHRKPTTNTLVVTSTPCPDDSSEDQIITISPIELVTDNVSNVPQKSTTTTTASPVKTPGKSDTIKDANNQQDDAQDDISPKSGESATTVSLSNSTSLTDNISDDKTIETVENKNTQTNDKTVVSQVSNGNNDARTAVYNSSELLDTNTDVPAESDDYSPVTTSPSVQSDVNTGDASDDNSLELDQSETDVLLTVSSSTANDSEDDIINICIEVSESTDNADSSSNEKTLVISIDTKNDSNDESKTSKTEGCKKDHNNSDGRGNNVEIDMTNLKGEPTMWIRTTNLEFIDKLMDKSDTAFDVIYFFQMNNQPVIEREKETTKYCNGTVVIETKETTYADKDDPTPTIVKTTQIIQLEDSELYSLI